MNMIMMEKEDHWIIVGITGLVASTLTFVAIMFELIDVYYFGTLTYSLSILGYILVILAGLSPIKEDSSRDT